MKDINEFNSKIKFLLTDIDDTLTDDGRLEPEAYQGLWQLKKNGIKVIPVTGRPAGWCEMIARQWPVEGVVGENGGFYFRYHNKKMNRHYFFDESTQKNNQIKLQKIKDEILASIPNSALASDQFCRQMDLAIDFCEDIPRLSDDQIQKIVSIFESHGAQAKISSIHVNGWFGDYNKLKMTLIFLKNEFNISELEAKSVCAFIGDSPNDEPMWQFFPHSLAVANIKTFLNKLKFPPQYICTLNEGQGFTQTTEKIIRINSIKNKNQS